MITTKINKYHIKNNIAYCELLHENTIKYIRIRFPEQFMPSYILFHCKFNKFSIDFTKNNIHFHNEEKPFPCKELSPVEFTSAII